MDNRCAINSAARERRSHQVGVIRVIIVDFPVRYAQMMTRILPVRDALDTNDKT